MNLLTPSGYPMTLALNLLKDWLSNSKNEYQTIRQIYAYILHINKLITYVETSFRLISVEK